MRRWRCSYARQGVKEPTTPDVRLTRSKDGSSGTATFVFNQPAVFEASGELGDITGLYLIDTEGELSTVDVQVSPVVWRQHDGAHRCCTGCASTAA